jgi:hypothetical protein
MGFFKAVAQWGVRKCAPNFVARIEAEANAYLDAVKLEADQLLHERGCPSTDVIIAKCTLTYNKSGYLLDVITTIHNLQDGPVKVAAIAVTNKCEGWWRHMQSL